MTSRRYLLLKENELGDLVVAAPDSGLLTARELDHVVRNLFAALGPETPEFFKAQVTVDPQPIAFPDQSSSRPADVFDGRLSLGATKLTELAEQKREA